MTSPSTELEVIEVPIDVMAKPSHPLILASRGFLSTLKDVETQVATLKITDATSAQLAAMLQNRLTGAGKKLNEDRLELKRPYMEMGAKIDELAKAPAARINAAKETLSKIQTDYAIEQQRVAKEAEKARQAELDRLEKIRQDEAKAEAARVAELERQVKEAAEKAKAKGVKILDFEEEDEPAQPMPPTQTEQKIAALSAPVAAAPRPAGVRMKVVLYPHIEDISRLPDVFIEKTAKLAAIQATYCRGWKDGDPLPVLAGVRFEVQRSTESTGRAQF